MLATLSSEENLARLSEIRRMGHRLWDPRGYSEVDLDEAVTEGIYTKKNLIVQQAGDPVEALVYIDPVCELGQPAPDYLQNILDGAAHFGLPPKYITGLARDWGVANATSGQRE